MRKQKKNKKPVLYAILFLLSVVFCGNPAFGAANKDASLNTQVITLDYRMLEQTEQYLTDDQSDLKEIPENILALNGKMVNIIGYFMVPAETFYSKDPITNFAVSKNAYGCPCCSWGDPPTIFNTIMVDTKKSSVVKPPFPPMVEVTGVFLVKKEQYEDEDGTKHLGVLFYIKDAVVKKKKQSFLKNIF
ncbi:hypothetical protein KKB40_00070 [Patescibacteria group bacterium]|nr:hypothetical protein [Patescibacteria group bacterium]